MASARGTSIYRFQAALALFNFEELGPKDANSKLDFSCKPLISNDQILAQLEKSP
jgi:hypothetical protein